MPGYRITKYDPKKRNRMGHFVGNDWISVHDIGGVFDSGTLTVAGYRMAEDDYVKCARLLMDCAGILELSVEDLGIFEGVVTPLGDEYSNELGNIQTGDIVGGDILEAVIRLALREQLWCRLIGSRGFYIDFGYDYYMYVGLPEGTELPRTWPIRMYFERFDGDSPLRPE